MILTTIGKCSWLSGWKEKRQITGKNIMPLKYSRAYRVAPMKGCLHPASTLSSATPVSSSSNFLLEGDNSSTPVPEYPTSDPYRVFCGPGTTLPHRTLPALACLPSLPHTPTRRVCRQVGGCHRPRCVAPPPPPPPSGAGPSATIPI